jgi:hypothetical protein
MFKLTEMVIHPHDPWYETMVAHTPTAIVTAAIFPFRMAILEVFIKSEAVAKATYAETYEIWISVT